MMNKQEYHYEAVAKDTQGDLSISSSTALDRRRLRTGASGSVGGVRAGGAEHPHLAH
jgi:hypothetical protein